MSKKYKPAPERLNARIVALLKKYHPELSMVKPHIDVLFATSTGDSPAVSHGGYPAYAVVRVVNLKDRAKNNGDAEIVIDQVAFEKMTEQQQDALLDHELEHLEVKLDEGGTVKFDACKRPCLGIKKHDRQFGWFDAIAQRHGVHSIEIMQARELATGVAGQLYFELQHEGAAAR